VLDRVWRGVVIVSASDLGFGVGERVRSTLMSLSVPVVHFKYSEVDWDFAWGCFDAVILVMALSGAVRTVCRYAKSKDVDPPVLVIDDGCRFVVPILGGHWGGNELAVELGRLLGATPVITTATELVGKVSVEELARRFVARIINPELIVKFNSAIIRGERVCLVGTNEAPPWGGFVVGSMDCDYVVNLGDPIDVPGKYVLNLKPMRIAIGIGSKSSVDLSAVRSAVELVLRRLGIDRGRVGVIASVREEVGVVADELGVPFRLVGLDELSNIDDPCLTPPNEKLRSLGIRGVAELAALYAGGPGSRLILRKVAHGRSVTVAAAAYEG